MLLTETFSVDFPSHLFHLYTVFVSPGIKLTDVSWVMLLYWLGNSLLDSLKQIHVEYDYCVVLQLSKELSGLDKDCILLGVYSPPSNSIYYKDRKIYNGMSLVENCIFDIIEQHGAELPFLGFGDLNARTGTANANDCVLQDSVLDMENDNDAQNQYCTQSENLHTNEFGRYLLCICEQFTLVMVHTQKV